MGLGLFGSSPSARGKARPVLVAGRVVFCAAGVAISGLGAAFGALDTGGVGRFGAVGGAFEDGSDGHIKPPYGGMETDTDRLPYHFAKARLPLLWRGRLAKSVTLEGTETGLMYPRIKSK